MKKSVSGQVIGAQMCSATDGSNFTGTVTVYVTGDGGTQAIGSVGSGVCTHEGNGFHTYAPSQAETNYDHVAFTFVGSGAISSTVQVYTSFPQTVDNATNISAIKAKTDSLTFTVAGVLDANTLRVGGTVQTARDIGASVLLSSGTGTGQVSLSAGLVSLASSQTFSMTGNITGNLSGSVGSVTGAVGSVTGNVGGNVTGSVGSVTGLTNASIADQVWDEVLSGHLTGGSTGAALNASGSSGDPWATALPGAYSAGSAGYIVGTNLDAAVSSVSGGSGLDAAGVRAAIGLASANLDTQLAAIDTVVDAVLVDTAEIGTAGAGLTALASAANLATLAGYVDTEVAAIKAKTDNLPASPAATGDIPTATQNADALLNRDMSAVSDTNARSPLNALRFLRNKWSIAGSTLTVTKEDDSTSAWTAAVSTTPGADPVTGNDPA